MLFIGIDPGGSGGIALIKKDGTLHRADKMPETESDIFHYFQVCTEIDEDYFAIIEKVNAFPGQGISSAWKFSGNYHGLRMALVASGIPFEAVRPQKWQQEMDIHKRKKNETKTQFKNRLKSKAQELFPNEKVTHAIGDALLIAECARRRGR